MQKPGTSRRPGSLGSEHEAAMTVELAEATSRVGLQDTQRASPTPVLGKLAKLVLWAALLIAPRLPVLAAYTVPMSALAVGAGLFPLAIRIVRSRGGMTQSAWTGAVAGAVVVTGAMLPKAARLWALAHPAIWLPMACIVASHLLIGGVGAARAYREASGPSRARLEAALSRILPEKLAKVAAHDINLIGYLFAWRRSADVPAGMIPFDYYQHVRPILFAFLAIAVIEALAAHLLFMHARPIVKWIVFAVDDIGLLYLLAFILSLSKLPIVMSREGLRVRAGVLIDQWIPMEDVASAVRVISLAADDKSRMLKASLMAYPNVIVTLKRPLNLKLPLRGERSIELIGLHPDDAAGFIQALNGMVASKVADDYEVALPAWKRTAQFAPAT